MYVAINDYNNSSNNFFRAAFSESILSPHILGRLNITSAVQNNSIYKNYSESKAKKYLKNKNLEINIKYNNGKESAVVWTTDLSYEYVEINAEYRT